MTLFELLIGLAILSLCAGLVFSNLGPWLAQSRQTGNDAAFWRTLAPAALTLNELSAAAIDPDTRHVSASAAGFRIYLPRLSPSPVDADLTITATNTGSTLTLSSPALSHPSVLMVSAGRLRFSDNPNALVLEVEQHGAWHEAAEARFLANAALTCAFDSISRTCR